MTEHIDSASDQRVTNNAVRHQYRVLTDAEKAQMMDLKDKGLAFIEACNALGKSRELSLAITNAEQAVMWAVKHVTA
jgi:hypothetical protein